MRMCVERRARILMWLMAGEVPAARMRRRGGAARCCPGAMATGWVVVASTPILPQRGRPKRAWKACAGTESTLISAPRATAPRFRTVRPTGRHRLSQPWQARELEKEGLTKTRPLARHTCRHKGCVPVGAWAGSRAHQLYGAMHGAESCTRVGGRARPTSAWARKTESQERVLCGGSGWPGPGGIFMW